MKNKFFKTICLAVLLSLSVGGWGCSKAAKKSKTETKSQTAAIITYTSKVQPLLAQKCTGCHSPKGTTPSIQLDTYDHVMKYIKAKDPAGSQLIQAVDGGAMAGKVTNSDVKLLKDWVTQGAKK